MAEKQFTANEVYTLVKNNLQERPTSRDFDNYWMDILNLSLVDLYDFNNAFRLSAGKEELTEIPWVSSKDDIIPYEMQVVTDLVVIRMCREFMKDEDMNKFNLFEIQYTNNYQRLIKLDSPTLSASSDDTE